MWSTEVYDADGETIAEVAWYPVPVEGGIGTARAANARLIAAAPDMLEALQEITDLCKREPANPFLADKMDRVAIAAIAKAVGHSDERTEGKPE